MKNAFVALILWGLLLPLPAETAWPIITQTDAPKLKLLPNKNGAQIWASNHFIIVCEVEITAPNLKNLAQTMESVPQLLKKHPLPLWSPPETEKAVVRLCRSETSFVARGGPVDAVGYYHPDHGEILIRGDFLLNPPKALPTKLPLGPNEDLLVHELTHLAMRHYGGSLPAWLREGLAEYFAACHTGQGRYDFTQSTRLIPQHIGKFYPAERFPTLLLPDLASLAGGTSRGWLQTNRALAPEERYRPYAAALLLAHYHLEGGTARREVLSDFLQNALASTLANKLRGEKKVLLTQPELVTGQLKTFWKSKGLSLAFEPER